MKKLLAIVLTAVLMLSVTAVSAAADAGSTAKYGTDVAVRLNGMDDDDKADFIVEFDQSVFPTDEEINEETIKKVGFNPSFVGSASQIREYFDARFEVRDELWRTAALALMDKMGVTFDDVKVEEYGLYTPDNVGRKGMPYAYTLTKAQVEKAVSLDEVTHVGILYPTGALIKEPNEKISESLMNKLAVMGENDKVGVWVWQYDIDDSVATRMVFDACGGVFVDNADLFRAAKTAVLRDYYGGINHDIVDALGIAEEDRVFISSLTPSFIVRLTAEQVWALAYTNKVVSMDRYEDVIYVSDEYAAKCQYLEAFSSWLNKKTGTMTLDIYAYRELYTKTDDDGEPIWAIVFAPDNMVLPWMARCGGIVGGRLISDIGGMGMSDTGYFLYDARENDFIDLTKVNAAKYAGLAKALEELKLGNPIGDMDFDKEITVVDATRMQRIIAGLQSFGRDDDGYGEEMTSGFKYEDFADYDRDGCFTVMDATKIQRHIAGIE